MYFFVIKKNPCIKRTRNDRVNLKFQEKKPEHVKITSAPADLPVLVRNNRDLEGEDEEEEGDRKEGTGRWRE